MKKVVANMLLDLANASASSKNEPEILRLNLITAMPYAQ